MSDSAVPLPPDCARRPHYVLWGCAILLILGVLLVGSCTAFLLQGKRALEPYGDKFFTAWDNEDYEGLRAMVAVSTVEGQPAEMMVESVRDLRAQLGPVQERGFRGLNISTSAEGGLADVTYRVKFAHGEGDVDLSFVDQNDVWMLSAVEITTDTPAPTPAEDPSTVRI